MTTSRCPERYPGLRLNHRVIRCELADGHAGEHGHSFAARYWQNTLRVERPCLYCGAATDLTDPDGTPCCQKCREDGGPNAGRDWAGREDLPYETWAE